MSSSGLSLQSGFNLNCQRCVKFLSKGSGV